MKTTRNTIQNKGRQHNTTNTTQTNYLKGASFFASLVWVYDSIRGRGGFRRFNAPQVQIVFASLRNSVSVSATVFQRKR